MIRIASTTTEAIRVVYSFYYSASNNSKNLLFFFHSIEDLIKIVLGSHNINYDYMPVVVVFSFFDPKKKGRWFIWLY